ncbi:twin-arginine translocase TatA/TatE family subunit [Deinococcus taklimakanensis]|uniref:Sec-independent protein translocase protein TatA n=1 Tax=Deinococcus taklimakanensis TaxID=536443 RepID=A0ABW5P3Z4_9DEIO
MGNLGPGELLIILLVALIVFGPRKLPELGKSLGAGLREFRRSTQGLKEELDLGLREVSAPAAAPVQTIHATVAPEVLQPQPVTPQAATPQTVTPQAVIPQAGVQGSSHENAVPAAVKES